MASFGQCEEEGGDGRIQPGFRSTPATKTNSYAVRHSGMLLLKINYSFHLLDRMWAWRRGHGRSSTMTLNSRKRAPGDQEVKQVRLKINTAAQDTESALEWTACGYSRRRFSHGVWSDRYLNVDWREKKKKKEKASLSINIYMFNFLNTQSSSIFQWSSAILCPTAKNFLNPLHLGLSKIILISSDFPTTRSLEFMSKKRRCEKGKTHPASSSSAGTNSTSHSLQPW